MAHDPHTGFIFAAYIIAVVVIASMVFAIVSDHRSLKRSLRRFGPRVGDRE